jgi:hypothetical protein
MRSLIHLLTALMVLTSSCSSDGGDDSVAPDSSTTDEGCCSDTGDTAGDVNPADMASNLVDLGIGSQPDLTDDFECTARYLEKFSGSVELEDGSPAKGSMAQFCIVLQKNGNLQCLTPTAVADDGTFEIAVPGMSSCIEEATSRVVMTPTYCTDDSECGERSCVPQRYADGGVCHNGFATMYCEADLNGDSPDHNVLEPFILHELNPPQDLPALGDEEEIRTVVYADGLEVDFKPFDIFASGGGYNALTARFFSPETEGFCHLESTTVEFEGLYAFAPESNIIGQSTFPIRIPNKTQAAPGTTYDLYILGGLQCQLKDRSHVGESEWKLFGQGQVNPEGTFIVTGEGEGLPCLNWLAYRLAP